MWQATKRRKVEAWIARGGAEAKAAWREAIANSEDVLTSLVFERLGYLPGDLAARIVLRAARPSEGLGWLPLPAPIEEVLAWPNLAGTGRVEPDWIWLLAGEAWVFEAKWSLPPPSETQLRDQHTHARATWPRRRLLHVVVVRRGRVDFPAGCEGVSVTWRRLRAAVAACATTIDTGASRRLLEDVLEVMDHRGLGALFMDSLIAPEIPRAAFAPLTVPAAEPRPVVLHDILESMIPENALMEALQ